MKLQQINVTLGTAGHIDHGKTALVKLLTGCETDRLKEEKERGMSIELGFAPCKVGDVEVGIVDVPGHEHFIKTMVAGATGIDAVILVIAADDGVMPQTREHLDILTLLGVKHGVVALTKIDRADEAQTAAVKGHISNLVKGTFLQSAPILPISNVTGEGFDGFYGGLMQLVNSIQPKSIEGVFRLPVERAFSVQGYGPVLSGIPVSGSISVGDEVLLLPGGLEGRVNGVQVYGQDAETARAGQCAAINVRHWDHTAIKRGDCLTVAGYFAPDEWYLCRLRLLPKENAVLKNGAHVKFHTGTSDVPAAVYLLETDKLRAGSEALVQIKLDSPLVAGPNDRFIVRSLSPVDTIGGGVIIESLPAKLRRTQVGLKEELHERAQAVPNADAFVEYAVKAAGSLAVSVDEVARRTKIPRDRVAVFLSQLAARGRILAIGQGQYLHVESSDREKKRILELLAGYHGKTPEASGMARDRLLEDTGLDRSVFDGVLEFLASEGAVVATGERVAISGHTAMLSAEDRAAVEKVEASYKGALFCPPLPGEVAASTGLNRAAVDKAMAILRESGRLVQLPEGLIFHREAIDIARERVAAHIRKEGQLESVKFKYLVDTTRKYAIPLLDYLDRIGVTLRVGNTRYLKEKR